MFYTLVFSFNVLLVCLFEAEFTSSCPFLGIVDCSHLNFQFGVRYPPLSRVFGSRISMHHRLNSSAIIILRSPLHVYHPALCHVAAIICDQCRHQQGQTVTAKIISLIQALVSVLGLLLEHPYSLNYMQCENIQSSIEE